MSKTIYVVMARRGDYSDRTEYAVCWLPTEKAAQDCAERMQQKSDEWRSRRRIEREREQLALAFRARRPRAVGQTRGGDVRQPDRRRDL